MSSRPSPISLEHYKSSLIIASFPFCSQTSNSLRLFYKSLSCASSLLSKRSLLRLSSSIPDRSSLRRHPTLSDRVESSKASKRKKRAHSQQVARHQLHLLKPVHSRVPEFSETDTESEFKPDIAIAQLQCLHPALDMLRNWIDHY